MVKTRLYSFPKELLSQSNETKTNYFKSITIPHRHLKEALDILLINILEPADTLVFLVFGVTGVGKTTLRLRLEKKLFDEFLPSLRKNPGQIAVAGTEAIPTSGGKFSYKDYYTRALEALNEVLIEYKVAYCFSRDEENDSGLVSRAYRQDAPALRRAMEKVFRYRQLKAFTVDEAQHLFMMAGGHQMLHQMNWIKSIANLTGTVHILFGTYELLNCPTLNGQIGRRSEDIHLLPYQADNPEDLAEFIRVIKTFQRYIPLPEEPKLEQHYEYLFSGSVGCVGLLKNWLTRSLRIAYSEKARTLKIKHLKVGAFSVSRINKIKEEAEQGFRRFQEAEGLVDRKYSTEYGTKIRAKKTVLKKGRVGQRKPKRDVVGVNPDEI
ncbi:MAG: ATP-binding protein [Nostocaceae cyanobacterium]|nr:ATP-binding protein [Nostocaceae cyanobacterium]